MIYLECRKCKNENQPDFHILFEDDYDRLKITCKVCGYFWFKDPHKKGDPE